jgi:hypothetical protein
VPVVTDFAAKSNCSGALLCKVIAPVTEFLVRIIAQGTKVDIRARIGNGKGARLCNVLAVITELVARAVRSFAACDRQHATGAVQACKMR